MDDSLKKKTQEKKKLQEHILNDDAIVDVSDEERMVAFEEDSMEIEEVFLDSDSDECLSGTKESLFREEASSLEEDSESEEEDDNLRPVQNKNGQI